MVIDTEIGGHRPLTPEQLDDIDATDVFGDEGIDARQERPLLAKGVAGFLPGDR